MKVIVSDYDNTFYLHNINKIINGLKLKKNIKAIKQFRKIGGIFIIATGRYFESIIKDIKKYHIPFDYLICNNGSEIYDCNYNLNIIQALDEHVVFQLKKLGFQLLYDKDYKYVVAARLFNPSKNILEKINKLNNINTEYHNNKIKVTSVINKVDAIKIILNNFNNYIVYSFGDDENDFAMLNEFNGYTLNKKITNNQIKIIKNLDCKIKEIIIGKE